jgi:DNA-binding CsgD family transcriptional regulator
MSDAACIELVDLCYRAVDDPAAWEAFVAGLTNTLDADAGDFVIEDYVGGSVEPFGSTGFDPGFRIDYDASFLEANPWIEQLKLLPVGRAFSNELEPEDFESSDYYNEWVRPQGFRHALGGLVGHDRGRAIHIGVLRNRGRLPFTTDDARLFDRLFPHLDRALRLRGRLDAAGAGLSPIDHLIDQLRVAAFLLGRDGRVLRLNAPAEAMLSEGAEFAMLHGRLTIRDPGTARAFEAELTRASRIEALLDAPGRSEITVRRKQPESPPLLLDLIPLRSGRLFLEGGPCCLALVIDPAASLPAPEDMLTRVWGLTRAESALARSLAQGLPLADHAAQSGAKIGTVRWHLKNIQTKLGVNSMAGVAALVQAALRRP